MLILHNLTPLHWAIAGGAIAAITLALLFLTNHRLGISSGFDDVCSLVLPQPYFGRAAVLKNRPWRLPFLFGLLLGGVLSGAASGGWSPSWDLGMFDRSVGLGPAGKALWMFTGGVLVGFGTRLAGGCTSGHGIFGLSNLEAPSLAATLAFMASGVVTTQLVYRVVFA